MSYHQLDINGRPLPKKGRTTRKPAKRLERGVTLYHYEIYVSISQPGEKPKQIRRRYWLPNESAEHLEAQQRERELKHEAPVGALTWREALRLWVEGNADFSREHIHNATVTVDMWERDFGAGAAIEGTSLAAFSEWIGELGKEGTGRAAQNRRAHLLAIARWARSRGLVKGVDFEHSPKPVDRMQKRRSATVEEFHARVAILPRSMKFLWLLLGMTGMRVSAACGIGESDIDETKGVLTVTTKNGKVVTYTITPALAAIIAEARSFKAAGWRKGRGKDKVTVPITTDRLFCNDRGIPWTKDTFNHKLSKIQAAANMTTLTPHQLRHMVGTLAAEGGMSSKVIQALLAHDSEESARPYVDLTQRMRDMALTAVSGALGDVEKLYKTDMKQPRNPLTSASSSQHEATTSHMTTCPCCGYKYMVDIKKEPQP